MSDRTYFILTLVVLVVAVVGSYYVGRTEAFKEMAAIAEEVYTDNQAGKADVFTSCLVDGWSQNEEFRKEWAARKVCERVTP